MFLFPFDYFVFWLLRVQHIQQFNLKYQHGMGRDFAWHARRAISQMGADSHPTKGLGGTF
jgi:hypothetical protein